MDIRHFIIIFILSFLQTCLSRDLVTWNVDTEKELDWNVSEYWSPHAPTEISEVAIDKFNPNIFIANSTTIVSLELGSTTKCACTYNSYCLQTLTIKENQTLTITSDLTITAFGDLRLESGASVIVSDTAYITGAIHGCGTLQAASIKFYPRSQIDPWSFTYGAQSAATLTLVGNVDPLDGSLLVDVIQNTTDLLYVVGSVNVSDSFNLVINSFNATHIEYVNAIQYTKNGYGTLESFSLISIPPVLYVAPSDSRDACSGTTNYNPYHPNDVQTGQGGCSSLNQGGFGVLLQRSTDCPACDDTCIHGYCGGTIEDPRCVCSSGWSGFICNIPICQGCNTDHGTCQEKDGVPTCVCKEGWQDSTCNTIYCPEDCNNNGLCSSLYVPPKCECDTGFDGDTCSITIVAGSCPSNCSNHGTCNTTTSTCKCDSGWTRFNCDTVECPGSTTMCNSHGSCEERVNPNSANNDTIGICNCESGWDGNACEKNIMTCPNDCSGSGNCDLSTGAPLCACNVGSFGSDCSLKSGTTKKGNGKGTKIAIIVSVVVGGAVVLAGAAASVVYAKRRKMDEDIDLQVQ